MIYFSSDLHFNHNKKFIYEARGFHSVEEMNTAIVKNFNKIITSEDDLFLLGDVIMGEADSSIKLFKQLKGNIHLIWGNHDSNNKKKYLIQCEKVREIGYADILKYNKYHFYLSHFPTITTNFDDNKPLAQKLLCLSGHTHSKEKFEPCYSYNVSVDAHNCYPVSIDEIINDFKVKFN